MVKMKKYLTPSKENISKEMTQTIFKLRCRMTDVKANFRGLYETYECEICEKYEETQEHILNCSEINIMKKDNEIIEYEQIFNGDVKDQRNIARIFKDNMDIRNSILNKVK